MTSPSAEANRSSAVTTAASARIASSAAAGVNRDIGLSLHEFFDVSAFQCSASVFDGPASSPRKTRGVCEV